MAAHETGTRSVASRIGRSVSLDHAAELLGVSRRTIYNRIREGLLQTVPTLGSSKRVVLQSVIDIGGSESTRAQAAGDRHNQGKGRTGR